MDLRKFGKILLLFRERERETDRQTDRQTETDKKTQEETSIRFILH